MNRTSRMTELLGAMRRERNGLVADTMRHYGTPCGLNYGVSLPTVRRIARMQTPDHDFARYLWLQEVRELRLAALHLAQPERVTPEELAFWAAGLVDSELAAEAAFALLGHIPDFPQLFGAWLVADEPLLRYAALLAASRSERIDSAWIVPTVEAVHRAASDAERGVCDPYAARLVAQGAVALLAAAGGRNEENRQAVLRAVGSLGKLPAEDCVHEELAWRL
jgi:hypothetical protein